MAGSAQIGSLRVALGIDSAEFQAGAKKAQSTLAGLGGSIKAFAAGMVGALSFGAVTAALKSAVNHMDDLGKAAQRIGIPVDQLSGLEYAAKLADVSLGDLETNVGRLSKALGNIAGGGKGGDAGAALRAMGVAATDANGKLRPTDQILADVAAKFATYKDGAEKSALAMALFGKSGAAMIPMLNGGREAIAGASDELERFGGKVTPQAAAAAEAFNDNLTRLQAAGQGVTQHVSEAMLPALVAVTNAMADFAKEGTVTEQITTAVAFVMKEAAKFVVEASAAWQEITTWVNAAGASFDALTSGDFSGAARAWSDASADVAKIWEGTAARIAKIDAMLLSGNLDGKGSLPSSRQTYSAPVLQRAPGGGSSKPAIPTRSETADMNAHVGTWDRWNNSIYMVGGAFDGVEPKLTDFQQGIQDIIGSGLSTWIDDLVDGTFNLKSALADLAKSLASTFLNGGMKSLFGTLSQSFHPLYGGSGGGGGFLSSMFSGLAGFADGGSFKVGGSGGIDSQLVAFKASPNERVDITKPGQAAGTGGSFALSYAPQITVQGSADETVMKRVLDMSRQQLQRDLPGMLARSRKQGRV